ncbi:MAG: hypothetical protein R6V35_00215 [Candidatus Nanohaloarchaea archaeon]
MGKGGAGNYSSEEHYEPNNRDTVPYNSESPFFQAEGTDVTDLAFFIGQFGEDDGEFSLNEYWTDPKTGFNSETIGPKTGEYIGGAIGERLDDFQNSGYNISVYDFTGEDSLKVTAAVSEYFPRSFRQRVIASPPEINHADGGLTVRGNLEISGEDLYESAKNSDLQEARLWPRADSALRKTFQVGMD